MVCCDVARHRAKGGSESEAPGSPPAKEDGQGSARQRRKKRRAQLLEQVEGKVNALTELKGKCGSEKYREAVPTNITPKLDIAIASLKEQAVALNLMAAEDWAGDAKACLAGAAESLQSASAISARTQKLLDMADADE